MNKYIVASSKQWHRKRFNALQGTESSKWSYVSTPHELKQEIGLSEPRYIFFLHWNWLVPSEICKKHECVCFHMTDVPYGRGGSPLQNLIVKGKTETMVSALRMVEEADAGPVYGKRPMHLNGRAEKIYLRAGDICWDLIQWIIADEPVPVVQHGEVTLFRRRKPEQSELPAEGHLEKLFDHIRMLDAPSYPLAFINHGKFRLKFSHAELNGDELSARVIFEKNCDGRGS